MFTSLPIELDDLIKSYCLPLSLPEQHKRRFTPILQQVTATRIYHLRHRMARKWLSHGDRHIRTAPLEFRKKKTFKQCLDIYNFTYDGMIRTPFEACQYRVCSQLDDIYRNGADFVITYPEAMPEPQFESYSESDWDSDDDN